MKILCFGDSNTWGYDPRGFFGSRYEEAWPKLLAKKLDCTVQNQGENGRDIPKFSVRFPKDTDLLIVMLGSNDLLQGYTAKYVALRMEHFLEHINLEKARILLIAPPPMQRGAWVSEQTLIDESIALNQEYKALSERLSVRFVDAKEWNIPLTFDGVHFTEEGHSTFAEGLFEYITKKSM